MRAFLSARDRLGLTLIVGLTIFGLQPGGFIEPVRGQQDRVWDTAIAAQQAAGLDRVKAVRGASQEIRMPTEPTSEAADAPEPANLLDAAEGCESTGLTEAPDPAELGPLICEPATERPLWRRVVLIALAVLAFVLGVVGWLVPVITGIPFYVVGLVCLAKASPWMAERINAVDRRLGPRVRRALRWRPGWLRRRDAQH